MFQPTFAEDPDCIKMTITHHSAICHSTHNDSGDLNNEPKQQHTLFTNLTKDSGFTKALANTPTLREVGERVQEYVSAIELDTLDEAGAHQVVEESASAYDIDDDTNIEGSHDAPSLPQINQVVRRTFHNIFVIRVRPGPHMSLGYTNVSLYITFQE